MKSTITAIALLLLAGICSADVAKVPYPDGYRNWRHVKSMLIEPGHPLHEASGGLHHLYANSKALQGYRAGHFPDGSVIAFDLLEAVGVDHAVTEGNRKVLGVMHKDARRYPSTGGWGFEGFAKGDKAQRVVGDKAAEACFACHQSVAGHDFVFSQYRN